MLDMCSLIRYDTAMRTDVCPVCDGDFTEDNPAVMVRDSAWRKSPRHQWHHGGALTVCEQCAYAGRATMDQPSAVNAVSLTQDLSLHEQGHCEACGVPVLYWPDKRRTRVYCSNRCRVSLTPSHQQPSAPESATCLICGDSYTQNRSDSRYCSNACRQKAARLRTKLGMAADEFIEVMLMSAGTVEQFEQALRRARDDGDLSRANVLKHMGTG